MFSALLAGTLLGFSLSLVFIGPSLFALIQTSIKNGFRSAAIMAIGISFSDVILVLLAYLGAAQFMDNPKVKLYEGLGGSIVLFVFGIYELFQKHEEEKEAQIGIKAVANINRKLPLMFVKGFFLNLLNPFVLFMWILWVSTVSSRYNSKEEVLAFFAGTLGVILTMDLLKSVVANRLKKILTFKVMRVVHYVMAIALIICGIVLVINVLSGKSATA